MKYICVADAFVTENMMVEGITPYISQGDTLDVFYFGEKDRSKMRNTVKAIESLQRDNLEIPEELYVKIADCDVLIVHLCPVTKRLLEKANQLKAILSCRGGVENIDLDYATQKSIIVTTDPAHNANAVAEYTIGLMICETRNIARSNIALKSGFWREEFPNTVSEIREIKDLTIGIIGFGSVGRLVAEKLSVFGCKILVYDPYISESAYDYINYRIVNIDTVLSQSDIISLHARSTIPIITKNEFIKMKSTAYLINTARSILVKIEDLCEALSEKRILGAAIDVFESEPNIPEIYKSFDNLTVTNHRGGDTINSYKDAPIFAIKNYLNFLNGERLRFWVNKDSIILGANHKMLRNK